MLSNRKSTRAPGAALVSSRVATDNGRSEDHPDREEPLNLAYILRLILFACAIFAFIGLEGSTYDQLPLPDESSWFGADSVARTRHYLDELASVTPRVAGTIATETTTKNMLVSFADSIKAGARADVNVEVDVQHPCGSLFLECLNGFSNAYCNITNVAVRISPKGLDVSADAAPVPTVLVNAHFDAFVMSHGASDDVVNVAVMLEVLNLLVRSASDGDAGVEPTLRHPIILLFNGAEESNLQAAHGFITQHPWARGVRVVLNLEALGAGGKELVFQCNSPWLSRMYAGSAPFPSSSAFAHELFQAHLHRVAATDWRAFVEYGPEGIAGLDTALIGNGYVYHTTRDRPGAIADGSLMHTGSNLVHLLAALTTSDELGLPQAQWLALNNFRLDAAGGVADRFDSGFVFFDLLGLWQVTYSGWAVLLLHWGVGLAALLTMRLHNPELFLWGGFTRSLTAVAADAALGGALGAVYSLVAPMRWYEGGVNYCLAIFVPAVVLAEALVYRRALRQVAMSAAQPGGGACAVALNSVEDDGLIYWATLLLLLGGVLKASYMFMLWAGCGLLAFLLRTHGGFTKEADGPGTATITGLSFLSMAVPAWMGLDFTRNLLALLIPMFGKTGSVLNTDAVLGAVMGLLVSGMFRLPLLHSSVLFPDRAVSRRLEMCGLVIKASAALIVCVLVYSVFVGEAYSSERPKRLWIQHLDRDLTGLRRGAGRDSGLWITGFDESGLAPLKEHIAGLDNGQRAMYLRGEGLLTSDLVSPDKHNGVICEVGDCYTYWPHYFPVAEALRDSVYVPDVVPVFAGRREDESDKRFSLHVASAAVSDGAAATGVRRVLVTMTGPSHMTLIINDRARGTRLLQWRQLLNTHSGSTEAPVWGEFSALPPVRAEGVHYVQIGFGLCERDCLYRAELLVAGEDEVVLSAYGHYVLMRDTAALQRLALALPRWSVGAEWTFFVSKLVATIA